MILLDPPTGYRVKPENFAEWLKTLGQALIDHGLQHLEITPLRTESKHFIAGIECEEREQKAVGIAAQQSCAQIIAVTGRDAVPVHDAH